MFVLFKNMFNKEGKMLLTMPYFTQLSKNNRNEITYIYRNRKKIPVIVKSYSYTSACKKIFDILDAQIKSKKVKFEEDDTLIISVFCSMFNRRSDSHNLIDALMDILQVCTGVNDRNFQINTWLNEHKRDQSKTINKLQKSFLSKGNIFIKIKRIPANKKFKQREQFEKLLTEKEKLIFNA